MSLTQSPCEAEQHALEDLPVEVLIYLLGSRYCETDRLSDLAWSLFGQVPKGWPLAQAICDYVHDRIAFDYQHASPTRTAWDAHTEQRGVCRDFAHLAVALCRCMNIPARYCTGYLGDIGVPPDESAMDFSAWFEVYLGGRWHTFDARHNTPRIGRILIARGRDATDVAMVTSFGPCTLASFRVIAEEITAPTLGDHVTPRLRRSKSKLIARPTLCRHCATPSMEEAQASARRRLAAERSVAALDAPAGAGLAYLNRLSGHGVARCKIELPRFRADDGADFVERALAIAATE